MPLFPPQDYRKTEFTHRIGIAADRPAAADVLIGTLYFSTDKLVIERSTGTVWEPYSFSGTVVPPGFDTYYEGAETYAPIGNIFSQNWINIPYTAGNFTGNGTIVWTVDSADQTDFSYKIVDGTTAIVNIRIENTDISGAGNQLNIALPTAITPKKATAGPALIFDAGNATLGGFYTISAGVASVGFLKLDTSNFTVTAADNTSVFVILIYEIK